MRHEPAFLLANTLLGLIAEHCERTEIAGSIRRGMDEAKDAEIVVIPKPSLLAHLDALLEQGVIAKAEYGDTKIHRWGEKYRGLTLAGRHEFKIELFMATHTNWGYILWLRTGPGDANKKFMTELNKTQYRAIDGNIYRADDWQRVGNAWSAESRTLVPIREEEDVFALLGLSVVPEWNRTPDTYWYARSIGGGGQYEFLPKHHAQRDEYENMRPTIWKHKQLPGWIRETQAEIAQLVLERDSLRAELIELRAKNGDAEAVGKIITAGMHAKHRQEMLLPLLKAYVIRYFEGLQFGFDELFTDAEEAELHQWRGD